MKQSIIAMFTLASSFYAGVDCWIVTNLQGQSRFSPDYAIQKNEAVGTYYVSITDNTAKLSSADDFYHSDLSYFPTSTVSMMGASGGNGASFVETWTITPDNKAIYTKVRSNMHSVGQLSSFIGEIIGKC